MLSGPDPSTPLVVGTLFFFATGIGHFFRPSTVQRALQGEKFRDVLCGFLALLSLLVLWNPLFCLSSGARAGNRSLNVRTVLLGAIIGLLGACSYGVVPFPTKGATTHILEPAAQLAGSVDKVCSILILLLGVGCASTMVAHVEVNVALVDAPVPQKSTQRTEQNKTERKKLD